MASHASKQDLEGLPHEILQQIAGHLRETPSLYAFSLASKTCQSAAFPSLFREIHLTVHSRTALQGDVDALIDTLSRTESARHVRCLSVEGFLRVEDAEPVLADEDGDLALAWLEQTGVGDILDGHEPVLCTNGWHSVSEPVIEKASREDLAWAPVVGLIKILPGLKTLVYNCRNQFPPLLLDTIHERQCKLHHMTFRLRSLLSETLDPYELALATSPCLYKAQVRYTWHDSNGDDDFNQEAMMELAAGLAPNLREVVVVGFTPSLTRWKTNPPREPWRGLPGFVPGNGKGSLTSLTFLGSVNWSLDALRGWAKHTDFDRLSHLGLGGGYTAFQLETDGIDEETMEWMINNCSFHRLRTLRVHLFRTVIMVERPNYADIASKFFKRFKPLDELSMSGGLEPKILNAILSRHGPTLQKLALWPIEEAVITADDRVRTDMPMMFEKENVLQIQTHCPLLRELAIPVKRTKSSAVEAEIYKSFGKMARLRSLFLTLDCSNWQVTNERTRRTNDPSFDQFDRELFMGMDFLQKGHLRETFMNCAVDETLARSIWETIRRAKVGSPLRSLRLWTGRGDQWADGVSNGMACSIIDNLSRSWLLEVRDGMEYVVDVRELGRQGREIRDRAILDEERRDRERTADDGARGDAGRAGEDGSDQWQIFRRIWPRRKEGSRDWREDWVSLPLPA